MIQPGEGAAGQPRQRQHVQRMRHAAEDTSTVVTATAKVMVRYLPKVSPIGPMNSWIEPWATA